MNISIAGYSFHGLIAAGEMNVFGYLESCRYRYALDTADMWNGVLGSDPEHYLERDFLTKVRDAMFSRSLRLVNYHADDCHIWEEDAAKREQNQALAQRHIEAAEFLGAATVRIDAGGYERYWNNEQFDHIVAVYRQWAQRAYDNGYVIGPETHWGPENYPDNMVKLCKAVAAPGFGILLHLGGKRLPVVPDEYDEALAPYAVHTHIDFPTCTTRLDRALEILRKSGYKGCLGVEHHSARNEYAEVAVQLAQVRRAVAVAKMNK